MVRPTLASALDIDSGSSSSLSSFFDVLIRLVMCPALYDSS